MEAPDVKAFLAVGTIGMVFGLLPPFFFRRAKHPFLWTAIASFVGGTIGSLLVGFVLETISSMTTHGYPLGRAMQAGVAAAFILIFVAPFVCGGPAAISGTIVQYCLQRFRRGACVDKPPPLPERYAHRNV